MNQKVKSQLNRNKKQEIEAISIDQSSNILEGQNNYKNKPAMITGHGTGVGNPYQHLGKMTPNQR
ncbi:MAG: hypothetical protein WCK52_02280 [Betaproteobacteria bacterium]|jgi:hypothetical protein